MSKMKQTLWAAVALAAIISPSASADWLQFSNSVFQAEEEVSKHPTTLTQVVVMPDDAARPQICVGYSSNLSKGNQGRVVTTVSFFRADGSESALSIIGGVKKNFYLNCKTPSKKLEAGDTLVFAHEFKNFPKVRNDAGGMDFADVNAVVSTAGKPKLGQDAPLGLVPAKGTAPLGLLPAESSGWFHSSKFIIQAETASQKHPKKHKQTLLIHEQTKRRPEICVAYSNIASEKNRGRVVTTATIEFPDGETKVLSFAGGVKDNEYLGCKVHEGRLGAGSMIDFSFELKNMPRLKKDSDATGFADINGVLSQSGEPAFREPPPPPPPPVVAAPAPVEETPAPVGTPAPPVAPTPPPPTNTSSLSAADQACISRVLYAAGGNARQIVRPKGNKGGKFEVFGPNSQVGSDGKPIVSTLGFGSTYAAACADYERKRGNMVAGPNLPSADVSLWVWYANMNSSAGPTAVRRDPRGGFHGDCFRPSKGAIIFNASSANGALKALQGAGL